MAASGTWFALIVSTDGYEGELYPETRQPACKMIRARIQERYGFNVNNASISQAKRKYGLIANSEDVEGSYIQRVRPEKETAIRKAFAWFGLIGKANLGAAYNCACTDSSSSGQRTEILPQPRQARDPRDKILPRARALPGQERLILNRYLQKSGYW